MDNDVAKIFEENAEKYDEWYERNRDLYLKELKIIEKPMALSIEIGVGSGRFASELGIDLGIDISKNLLEIARKRGVEVVRGDAYSLPFKDKIFKSAYFIFTLCFLKDPKKAISEAYRILSDDGKLIACVIPLDSKLGEEYSGKESIFYRIANFFRESEIKDLLQKNGFKIVRIKKTKLKYSDNDFVCFECLKM